MRKPTFLALALIGATASLTLGIPDHGYAAGPSLPIVGKLPIPAPPSVPGVPSLPGLPGTPSLPSLPNLGSSAVTLPGVPENVSPTDLISQNVAYAENPNSSPVKEGASALTTVSSMVLPLVPNAPENPSTLILVAQIGGLEEIAALPPADRALVLDLAGADIAPGTPDSMALTAAATEITSSLDSSPAGPYEKSELTPALKSAVTTSRPVLSQTAAQLDTLPALPSLPSGTLPSTSSLPSTTTLTQMASLPSSSSLPSTSSLPSSSSVTKTTSSLTRTSSLPKSSSVPSSPTLSKEAKTSSVTKMSKGSPTKSLPKT